MKKFLSIPFFCLLSISAFAQPKVLIIGDSLSTYGFGPHLKTHLVSKFGNAALYARSGYSPESWMRNDKLNSILSKEKPNIVIVQLGTNWFDNYKDSPRYTDIIQKFVNTLRNHNVKRIVWVTPPNSSRFSTKTQNAVTNRIAGAAQMNGFDYIDSGKLTRYTGRDGVHYNTKDANEWARKVEIELDKILK